MKKLFLFLVLLAFTSTAFAQISVNGRVVQYDKSGYQVLFTGVLDSLGGAGGYDSLVTNSFSLTDYDGSDYFTLYRVFANADTAKYKIILKASEDNVTFTDLATAVDTSIVETQVWTPLNLSGARASYYKLGIYAIKANYDGTTFTIKLIAPKRDY